MRCSNCLYDNRAGVTYCEHCGSPLPVEVPLFNTCQECGFLNPPDEKYCERCGVELEFPSQFTPIQVRRMKTKKRRRTNLERKGFPVFTLLFVIFFGLILVGAMPSSNDLAPMMVHRPPTLVTLEGILEDDAVLVAAEGGFSASALDDAGIARMELYSDGQLAAARNFDGTESSVVFSPVLDALPAGQHAIIIRSINSDGETNHSRIVTVLSSGSGDGLMIDPDPQGLTAPDGLIAEVSEKGDSLAVSWNIPDDFVTSTRIYCRPPGSSGLIQVGEVDSTHSEFVFPVNTPGYWEIYVSFCDGEHREGPLGFADLFVLQPGISEGVSSTQTITTESTLPAPEQLHMAATTADCQLVASALGSVRDALYRSCQAMITRGDRQFLLWQWPPKLTGNTRFTENDLTGFELKMELSDLSGQSLGESFTSLPFAEARGMVRSSYAVDCGVKQTWYLRAVGSGNASAWVYAGTVPAEACDQPLDDSDGCSGQMDYQTAWGPFGGFVPDIAFASACESHDRCYTHTVSGKTKVTCDNEFLADMLDVCADNAAQINPNKCAEIASSYYDSVNLYGRYTYEGSTDLMDCLNAVEPGNCFTGSSPEFLTSIYNRMKTGVFWTKEAVETGAEKIWHGTVWLSSQVWRGIDGLIHR